MSTLQCLGDYAQRFNVTDGIGVMCDFHGVTPGTVLGWLLSNGSHGMPKGEQLLKLRCFLRLVGYRVAEVESEDLPAPARKLAEIIGLGVVSARDADEELDYKAGAGGVFRITLQSALGLTKDRADKLQAFVDRHEAQRELREQKWLVTLRARGICTATSTTSEPYESEAMDEPTAPRADVLQSSSLAVLLGASLQSAAVVSDGVQQLSPEEQSLILGSVAAMVGADRLYRLAERLTEM
jgi:hypothetical protein